MTNEHLLTAAKLYEQVAGDLDDDSRLHPHAGLPMETGDSTALTFVESAFKTHSAEFDVASTFSETKLGGVVDSFFRSEAARDAIMSGNSSMLSYLVGITEQDLDASSLTLPFRLMDELDNGGAPAFVLGAGNPNTGKTNSMSLLAEVRALTHDEYLVLSNSPTWERTDIVTPSAHDLLVALLEHREMPKFVMIDESSTHFDARTKSHDVASQWTPLAKAMAKLHVDVCGNILHTGKDGHPELKRLATLAYWKEQKDVAEFYAEWPEDSSTPTNRLFGGRVEHLEPTSAEYDPDDATPWAWNLDVEILGQGHDWPDVLDRLKEQGPVDD